MRDQYHRPKVLKRMNRTQWIGAGKPDEFHDAQAEADRLVAAFNYEPPPGTLKALRAIYDAARKKLAA
jgi:trimethylamine:corrinoid methyltransferase-like protein